jgi:hypothetical protein
LVNSRLGLFTAALRRPARARSEDRSGRVRGRSFSRSYGARLPSSLARVLSRTLASYARLPVSVCSTDTVGLARGYFLAASYASSLWSKPPLLRTPGLLRRIYLPDTLGSERAQPIARWYTWRRHPIASLSPHSGAGMSTGCPSPTPFGLGLGPAKPRGTNLAWETLGFR